MTTKLNWNIPDIDCVCENFLSRGFGAPYKGVLLDEKGIEEFHWGKDGRKSCAIVRFPEHDSAVNLTIRADEKTSFRLLPFGNVANRIQVGRTVFRDVDTYLRPLYWMGVGIDELRRMAVVPDSKFLDTFHSKQACWNELIRSSPLVSFFVPDINSFLEV